MPQPSSILFQRHEAIAVVSLNRPDKLNALTPEMLLGLDETLNASRQEPELRAVILTGIGNQAFSVGYDSDELSASVGQRGGAVSKQIEEFPLPVIAAINGVAAGAGLELAFACHLRLAAPHAELRFEKTQVSRLAREVTHSLDAMPAQGTVTAEEAARLGLVNEVTGDDVMQRAQSLAHDIASLAPLAIRACLRAIHDGLELPLPQALALETELFASLFSSQDMREGTKAFLEKRPAVFKGQ
jgi:enoyl-CoA hydratase